MTTKQITKREFLKKLGLLGAAGATGAAFGDVPAASSVRALPPGAIGDPELYCFGSMVYPIPHTVEDGPSCFMKDGKVFMPAREVPRFHETDVVVVGGGPAGVAAALAAQKGVAPRSLAYADLKRELVRQKAYLG